MGKRRKGSNKKRDATFAGLKDAVSDEEGEVVGVDGVYGEVDQWEKDEDTRILSKVKFKGSGKVDDGPEEMFALSGTDSDSDLELPTIKKLRKKAKMEAKEGTGDISDSDIEDNAEEVDDLRRWGTKKKHYYGGNTGEELEDDLEGSDLEEDKMEEMEAAKLQSRQLEMMEEEDFLDTYVPKDQVKNKSESKAVSVDSVTKDFSKLSAKEQKNLFRQQNPEFDGVISDFKIRMEESIKLSKVVNLAADGLIPDGPCLEFARYKLELLLNYCTNVSAYIMFKSQGVSLTLHPVTTRLVQYRQLIDKVEAVETEAMTQIDALVKRLDTGDDVKTIVKEERRRAKKSLEKELVKKSNSKNSSKKSRAKKEKQIMREDKVEDEDEEEPEELTRDERMALEVYDAIKKSKGNKNASESEEENESEEEDEVYEEEDAVENDENEPANTYNNENQDLEEDDIDEKRAITYKIAKNKGLTPKRSKLQRNPRVKNRMKYSKALKRRKGAVREVRDQNSKYGGEASGINMRVKKGVKFS